MRTFNLIPDVYLRKRRFYADLRLFSVFVGVLIIALLVVNSVINNSTKNALASLQQLQDNKKHYVNQTTRLSDLDDDKVYLNARLSLLRGLQGDIPFLAVFRAMDEVLSEGIEFTYWAFDHEAQVAENGLAVDAGNAALLASPESVEDDTRWQFVSSMVLHGSAQDHSTMGAFIQKLSAHPAIAGVDLLRSDAQGESLGTTIAFEVRVLLSQSISGLS